MKQETVSGSGISWAICKSAPRSRQITTPAPHYSVFTGRMPFLPPNQQRQSTEGICCRVVQQLTIFRLTQRIARSVCEGRASCFTTWRISTARYTLSTAYMQPVTQLPQSRRHVHDVLSAAESVLPISDSEVTCGPMTRPATLNSSATGSSNSTDFSSSRCVNRMNYDIVILQRTLSTF